MLKDLNFLCNEFGRSPFIIIKSKEEIVDGNVIGNYQAICLDKMTSAEVVYYQRMTHCDMAYTTMPLRNVFRSWVLRATEKGKRKKPEFSCMVGDKNLSNFTSTAHYKWLRKQYNIPEIKYSNGDKLKKLFKNTYETWSRTE
jgi:hypothetical protein